VDDYLRLRSSTNWGTVSDAAIAESFSSHQFCVHAVNEQSEVIGVARVVGDRMYAYVQDLIVEPRCRRKGIGTRLMKEVLKYLDANAGAGGFVGLMAAKGTMPFYRNLGFITRPDDAPGMQIASPNVARHEFE